MDQSLAEVHDALNKLLSPVISEIPVAIATEPGPNNPFLIDIPQNAADLPVEDLASLVARTSNAYVRAARYSGIASAYFKLAKGRFDRKYKKSRVGGNDAERDRNAMESCEQEHAEMILAESISDLASKFEAGARVASESIRKIYGAAQNMATGQRREETGAYKEEDFAPW